LVTVEYRHQVEYSVFDGDFFPALLVRVTNPLSALAVDVDARVDSGAQMSIFSGDLCPGLEIDLLTGTKKVFATIGGAETDSRIHRVELAHSLIGTFAMDIAFSINPIFRNLLGRDFFDRLDLGFSQRNRVLYLGQLHGA
jgi:hypothetical protein